MENNKSDKNKNPYKYFYIYDLIEQNFKFNKYKYEGYIKDIITILVESEKRGEALVSIEEKSFLFDLIEEGWPENHLNALKRIGLINKINSPIIFKNKTISFVKWSNKINYILNDMLDRNVIQTIYSNYGIEYVAPE